MTDPIQLLRDLDEISIRERIDAIDREREALMVLLRAAVRGGRNSAAKQAIATTPTRKKRKGVRA
jgi:hypothetical protein